MFNEMDEYIWPIVFERKFSTDYRHKCIICNKFSVSIRFLILLSNKFIIESTNVYGLNEQKNQ